MTKSLWALSAALLTALCSLSACTLRPSQVTDEGPGVGADPTFFAEDLKLVEKLKKNVGETTVRWIQYGPEEEDTEDFAQTSLALFKRNSDLHQKTYQQISQNLPAQVAKDKRHSELIGLLFLDESTWLGFVRNVANHGYPNQGISNSLPPFLARLPDTVKQKIYDEMGTLYTKAYKSKYNLPAPNPGPYGDPMAPKRALDAVLRFMIPLEEFFESVNSPEEALEAYEKHLALLRESVLKGTDHGQYDATDVLGVSRYVQKSFAEVLKSVKVASTDPRFTMEQIVLKGSLPSGRANLVRRSPWDNPVETILHGVKTSYSDIDMNVGPAEAMGPLKERQGQAWTGLQSTLAKDTVTKSKAQADFQLHPRDPYGELHGSRLSPVGIRITPNSIKIVVYSAFRLSDLPPKKEVEAMTFDEQESLLKKYSAEFDAPAAP